MIKIFVYLVRQLGQSRVGVAGLDLVGPSDDGGSCGVLLWGPCLCVCASSFPHVLHVPGHGGGSEVPPPGGDHPGPLPV